MTYTLTLDGLALHHYGQGVYGWGPTSSTTGQPGRLVEWECAQRPKAGCRPAPCSAPGRRFKQ